MRSSPTTTVERVSASWDESASSPSSRGSTPCAPSTPVGSEAGFAFFAPGRGYLHCPAVPSALFFSVVLKPFINFSGEVKHYGFDVLVTLVLLAVFSRVVDKPLTNRGAALLATVG